MYKANNITVATILNLVNDNSIYVVGIKNSQLINITDATAAKITKATINKI
jgi:hypothetical protein